MSTPILCACTKEECSGICREKHLYRKRKTDLDQCPAAYDYDVRNRKEVPREKTKH